MNFRTKQFDYEVEYFNYHLQLPQDVEVDYWRDKQDCYIDWNVDFGNSTQYLLIEEAQVDRVYMKLYYCIDLDDLGGDQIIKICFNHEGEVLDRLEKIEGYIIIDTLVQKDWQIRMDLEYRNRLQPREVFVNLMDREIVII